jgi:hypothetical protein
LDVATTASVGLGIKLMYSPSISGLEGGVASVVSVGEDETEAGESEDGEGSEIGVGGVGTFDWCGESRASCTAKVTSAISALVASVDIVLVKAVLVSVTSESSVYTDCSVGSLCTACVSQPISLPRARARSKPLPSHGVKESRLWCQVVTAMVSEKRFLV